MMKKLCWLTLAFAGMSFVSISATAQEAKIRDALQNKLGNNNQIGSIIKLPSSSWYEVTVGDGIIYTDAESRYVFVGRILEAESSKDLTQARLDELNRVKFSEMPLDLAVKRVKGSGARVIAVFEDPNCNYCKRFRQTLAELNDVTVYTFIYPLLGEDSLNKARNLWCATDQAKAWDDWMLNDKTAPQAPESCSSSAVDKVMELGRKFRVSGTPTIFFTDGSRIPGAIDAKTLESKLAAVKHIEIPKSTANQTGVIEKLPKNQSVSDNNPFNIEDAKAKCADLGFKKNTEAFGKCVLKITQ